MSVKQDIKIFTEKLSVKFALAHYLRIYEVARTIQRYLRKEMTNENKTEFSSQDLRSFVIAIEKVHKAVNKKISFIEFQKALEKHKRVDGSALKEETKKLASYCQVARHLQSAYSMINHSATLKYLLELSEQQEKESSDNEFTNSIVDVLVKYDSEVSY